MLDPKKKQRIIAKFKTHDKDTGSAEVQIAILSEEIKELTKHLQEHRGDFSSRRGLLKKIGERKRLLRYLRADNLASYQNLVKELKLRVSEKFEQREEEIKRILEAEDAEDLVKAPTEEVPEEVEEKEE
jgi:small subunit ribosomal protein S15